MSDQPYISFVVTSRNDNHGGDMRKRMNIFVNGLIHQCNKYKLKCELVMIDWNSPDPNELLDKVLPKTTAEDFLTIRYIVVPKEIHNQMNFSEHLGLYQMIAKNVGIRRSNGNFIVCTNVDLLFSNKMFERLSRRDLKEGVFYRANRCDIPNTIQEDWSVEEQLEFSEKNIKKRLGKHPIFGVFKSTSSPIFNHKFAYPLLKFLASTKRVLIGKKRTERAMLDFDACGDFTLMSKADWEKIEGYVELQMYSLHIDSMAIYAAHAKGLLQEVFEPQACTFHMEHTGGWEIDDPIERIKFYSKRPSLDWWFVEQAGEKIIRERSNYGINDENWGLNNIELQEIDG